MAVVSLLISRITSNINGLSTPIKSTEQLAGLKDTQPYAAFRHPSQLERQTRAQSDKVEDETSRKRYPEKSRCSYTYFRQSRL